LQPGLCNYKPKFSLPGLPRPGGLQGPASKGPHRPLHEWPPVKSAPANGPVYFATPMKGVLLELGISAWGGGQKLESWGYRAEKDVWWYLQPSGYNTVHERGGQTDGHRPTAKTALTHGVAR